MHQHIFVVVVFNFYDLIIPHKGNVEDLFDVSLPYFLENVASLRFYLQGDVLVGIWILGQEDVSVVVGENLHHQLEVSFLGGIPFEV